MTDIQLGISGAKRATWREADTRPILRQIVKQNPDASRTELFRLFWSEIKDDEDQVKSIAMYWFDLAMNALHRPTPAMPDEAKAARTARTRTAVTAVKKSISARIEQEARMVLLTMIMPNGKTLGDCTGSDCRKFGNWYAALANKVLPKQTVSSVLSEDEVYQIWQRAEKK